MLELQLVYKDVQVPVLYEPKVIAYHPYEIQNSNKFGLVLLHDRLLMKRMALRWELTRRGSVNFISRPYLRWWVSTTWTACVLKPWHFSQPQGYSLMPCRAARALSMWYACLRRSGLMARETCRSCQNSMRNTVFFHLVLHAMTTVHVL